MPFVDKLPILIFNNDSYPKHFSLLYVVVFFLLGVGLTRMIGDVVRYLSLQVLD